MIVKVFKVGLLENNTILVGSEGKAFLVDPADGSSKVCLHYLEKKELSLELILLTHSHWDHIGDVYKIKESTKALVYVHKEDENNLKYPGSDMLPLLSEVKGVAADGYLKDGQKLRVGDVEITVIHTPGHSMGSVCFYIAKEGLLLSGDTLFSGSIGRIDFPSSSPELMWKSLKKLSHLPKETRVIPGHGSETTIGRESWLSDAESYFS